MRGLADAGRAVDLEADEAVAGRSASPQWRPTLHPHALVGRPGVARELALDLERGAAAAGAGVVEDAEELVAAAVDLAAAGLLDRAALQLAGFGSTAA